MPIKLRQIGRNAKEKAKKITKNGEKGKKTRENFAEQNK